MAKKKTARTAKRTTAKKTARKTAKPKAKAAARRAPARAGSALIGSLGLVTLHVTDIKEAVRFYRDALGLPAGDVMDTPEMGWAEFNVGGLKLGLHADPKGLEPGGRAPGGATGFYFVVKDVDASVKKLRERGVKIVDEPEDKSYGRDACFQDPDGNVIAIASFS